MWRNEPWGDGTYQTCDRYGNCTTNQDPGDAVQQTWQEVWTRMGMQWFARYVIGPAFGSTMQSQWSPGHANSLSTDKVLNDEKDQRALSACSAFKNAANGGRRPQIYTISFNAPSRGVSLLRQCASSTGQFYNVDDTQASGIQGAFSAIASSINKLRLTY